MLMIYDWNKSGAQATRIHACTHLCSYEDTLVADIVFQLVQTSKMRQTNKQKTSGFATPACDCQRI